MLQSSHVHSFLHSFVLSTNTGVPRKRQDYTHVLLLWSLSSTVEAPFQVSCLHYHINPRKGYQYLHTHHTMLSLCDILLICTTQGCFSPLILSGLLKVPHLNMNTCFSSVISPASEKWKRWDYRRFLFPS